MEIELVYAEAAKTYQVSSALTHQDAYLLIYSRLTFI